MGFRYSSCPGSGVKQAFSVAFQVDVDSPRQRIRIDRFPLYYSWDGSSSRPRRWSWWHPVGVSEPEFPLSVSMFTGARLAPGNRIEVLLNGDSTYPRLWQDLRSAIFRAPAIDTAKTRSAGVLPMVGDVYSKPARAPLSCSAKATRAVPWRQLPTGRRTARQDQERSPRLEMA
jgi:hypothetical protein